MYIDLPNIQEGTPEHQLDQIRDYVFRLNQQLNVIFADIESKYRGYTGNIKTHTGETLVFKNGLLISKE